MRGLRRRAAGVATVLAAVLGAAAPARAEQTPARSLTDADYLAFADHVTAAIEDAWDPRQGEYRTGPASTIVNAAMLTVFATAAAEGHVGPARDDARARQLVARLTGSPPYYTDPAPPHPDKMFHSPGWTSNLGGPYIDMDKSIDPKVGESLTAAYQARDVLGLEPAAVQAIRDEVRAVSHVAFFRYPLVRLNQINWNAELYAEDYLVNGDPGLLRDDYRAHLRRFVAGFRRPLIRGGATNVGPSYRFIYQVNRPAGVARNLDSAEYANMTLHVLRWYGLALQAGMRPLSHEDRRLLRGWVQRDLYGYWTHAGFLNWDTGWSYGRWMKGKTWAFAQQGLIAIATAPAFTQRPREAGYAKRLFDRGLRLYEHLGREDGAPWRPRPRLFGIGADDAAAATVFWARTAANAARAVAAGMGRMTGRTPPPFYAFDADIGRLAVSTPRYSTAILAVNRSKVPYGGMELARLYDAHGDPVGGTGGRAPGSFGIVVDRAGPGGRVLASQQAAHRDPAAPPVVLTRSPRGPVTRQKRLATHPDAGPFRVLESSGAVARGGVRVLTRHRFERDSIETRWTVTRHGGAPGPQRVRATFPTSGPDGVTIHARLRDGRTVQLTGVGGARPRLRDVRRFDLRSAHGAYRVRLLGRPPGTTTVLAPHPERANPRAGPTLVLELPPLPDGGRRSLSVRIVPSAAA